MKIPVNGSVLLERVGREIRMVISCDDETAAIALHAGLIEEAREGDMHLRLLVTDVMVEH